MSESENKSEKKAQKLAVKQSGAELLLEKIKIEEQLRELREEYGNVPEKKIEPKMTIQCRWNYIMNEMNEMQEYMGKRKEYFKYKSKKIAEQAINKRLKYFELIKEREKTEQRNQEKVFQRISKCVQREYWKSVHLLRRQILQHREDKIKEESQKQKLDDIVRKLNEITEEVGIKLSAYQNQAQEEETTQIPIEKYRTLYFELQRRFSMQQSTKCKKFLSQTQSNIIITLKKLDDERFQILDDQKENAEEGLIDADQCIIDLKKEENLKFLFPEDEELFEQQPYLLNGTLRSYQLVGMHWIASLHHQQMNGILADEMGLGKTIQTIALLAHLAANKSIWGPHLVIVPTSILMNWEIEFKRWCPAFKIMTYFGSPKERKLKRQGWSQLNSFHVCITSYKIVIQDAKVFRRKKWYFMILDEAQHIKNFKSQRWQTLLNFSTKSRLLLTGTPLQNDLGEIWSLLHFLMPTIFDSHTDFLQWFSSIEKAIQDNQTIQQDVLIKLHDTLRPFVLRRLKKDVEKQLPSKTEVIVKCNLSRRQKYLYDEFIHSSGDIKIQSTEFIAVMNVVQQLRKVCNHPELFEQRPVEQPLLFQSLKFTYPKQILFSKEIPRCDYFAQSINFPSIASMVAFNKYQDAIFNQTKTSKFGQRWAQLAHEEQTQRFKTNMQRMYQKIILYHALLTYNPDILTFQNKMVPNFVIPNVEHLLYQMKDILNEFCCIIRKVDALPPKIYFSPISQVDDSQDSFLPESLNCMFPIIQKQRMLFPNKKLLIYDCGKMNTLVDLIFKLKAQNHKIIIFTQMTKMLDLFEAVLSLCKITYLRLDGSTPIEMRQKIVERFNQLPITCFISSTRSGGIGLNLTGADTVIFYDTDWNPAMDKQAQDRCHRIGQTRSVTIYRLITTSTIEENILLKALQKRQLDDFVMQSGMFSPEQIMKQGQIFTDDDQMDAAMKQVEDKEDRQAAQKALVEEQNYQLNGLEEIMEIEGEYNMDWLNIAQLPPLVKFGLKMTDKINEHIIQNNQDNQPVDDANDDDEEDDDNEDDDDDDENDNDEDNEEDNEEDDEEQNDKSDDKMNNSENSPKLQHSSARQQQSQQESLSLSEKSVQHSESQEDMNQQQRLQKQN